MEMSHPTNGNSLCGLEVLDEAKAEVEKECPRTMSCADILTFAARDSAILSGNPKYSVPASQHDTLSSTMGDAEALPVSKWSVDKMTEVFGDKSVDVPGVDSILYGPFGEVARQKYCRDWKGTPAFNLDDDLVLAFPKITVQIKKESSKEFGGSFYKHIMEGKGLPPSNLGLVADEKTREIVKRFASNSTLWAEKFSEAMVQLGNLNVLIGNRGEIRKVCSLTNN
ncbi:hypothetical protein Ancab_015880 [Ancistrocladus abbreviatus]